MLNLLSSIGMEESRNVSDKQMVSISLTSMKPKRDNLINLRVEPLRDPGLDSLSPDFNKRKLLM